MSAIQSKETVVIGSVKTREHAERIIKSLKKSGLSDNEISVISP
jgi:cell division protein FtsN